MEQGDGHAPKILEGLRILPWLQEQARNASGRYLADCGACKAAHSAQERRAMACGYEPPSPTGIAWRHRGDDGPKPEVCPGYTCTLPEVIEVSRMRAHWKTGQLAIACDGPPQPDLLDAILTLEWAHNAVEAWALEEARKK